MNDIPGYSLLAWDGQCQCRPLMPETIEYSNECDAHWCKVCNEWLDRACRDPQCPYCTKRKEKPSDNDQG